METKVTLLYKSWRYEEKRSRKKGKVRVKREEGENEKNKEGRKKQP
jgi:hypothetical protein